MDKDYKRALRRKDEQRVWNNRLKGRFASWGYHKGSETCEWENKQQNWYRLDNWTDLKAYKYWHIYKNISTPCSCPGCTGEHYSRLDFKKDTDRIIREEFEANL